MKSYIKPDLSGFEMAPVSILEGSVEVKGKIGVSSFFTDDQDWETEETTQKKKYSFWE